MIACDPVLWICKAGIHIAEGSHNTTLHLITRAVGGTSVGHLSRDVMEAHYLQGHAGDDVAVVGETIALLQHEWEPLRE